MTDFNEYSSESGSGGGYAHRLLHGPRQEPQFHPEPVPSEGVITVANDQKGTHEHIPAEEWPQYQAQGWRYVPNPGANAPTDSYRNPTRHVDDAPQSRDLFPREAAERAGGQTGWWAWRTATAQKALDSNANAVADFIGRPTVDAHRFNGGKGRLQPSGERGTDYLALVYVGEATVKLLSEVQELRALVQAQEARIAALEAAGSK